MRFHLDAKLGQMLQEDAESRAHGGRDVRCKAVAQAAHLTHPRRDLGAAPFGTKSPEGRHCVLDFLLQRAQNIAGRGWTRRLDRRYDGDGCGQRDDSFHCHGLEQRAQPCEFLVALDLLGVERRGQVSIGTRAPNPPAHGFGAKN